ncbi:hypothetical protein D3C81_2273470 [compost metagenome]
MYIKMFMDQTQKLMEMVQQMGNVEKIFEELMHVFFYGICGREPFKAEVPNSDDRVR